MYSAYGMFSDPFNFPHFVTFETHLKVDPVHFLQMNLDTVLHNDKEKQLFGVFKKIT